MSDRLPDFGLASKTEVGPAHIGLILFIATFATWFEAEQSSTADWIGFVLFLAGCGLWALDPPPDLRLKKEGTAISIVGAAGVAYGWWSGRLPIAIAGGGLLALSVWILWRRLNGRR
jgi:hypothetical protein